MQRPPRFFYRAYFGLTWLPITPPTAAPPTAPTALPPVSTEPATAPTPAPMAVFLSWPDILAQAVRLKTSAASEVVAASFLMVCMMVSPLDSNPVALTLGGILGRPVLWPRVTLLVFQARCQDRITARKGLFDNAHRCVTIVNALHQARLSAALLLASCPA